jgi:hypothetical protein
VNSKTTATIGEQAKRREPRTISGVDFMVESTRRAFHNHAAFWALFSHPRWRGGAVE